MTVYLSFLIARPFLTPIFTAAMFAVAIYPPVHISASACPAPKRRCFVCNMIVLLLLLLPRVLIVNPLMLSGRVKLHPLLVLFFLIGGVKAFGIVGLFVGPIIVSVAMALLRVLAGCEPSGSKRFRLPQT